MTVLSLALVSLFLSIILTTFNRGFFSFAGLSILILLDCLLFFLFLKGRAFLKRPVLFQYQHLLIITYTLFLFFNGGVYQTEYLPSLLLVVIPILCFPLVITYALPFSTFSPFQEKLRFFFLLFVAVVLRILIIIASPSPIIDVFAILKEAPLVLLRGENPYGSVFSPVYSGIKLDYFPYWPASFLLQIPFVALFSDPRILMVFSDMASAILLFLFGKKTHFTELLILIYLFRPNSLFIIEQSWLTPLVFFFVLLSFFLLEKKRDYLAGVSLGLLACLQPYFSVFFLLFSLARRCLARLTLGFLFTIVVLVLPFFLLDPFKFIDQTILFYFKPKDALPTIPFYLSLNLNTFFYQLTGEDIPLPYCLLAITITAGIIAYRLLSVRRFLMTNQKYFKSQVLMGTILFFLNFYIFFRQSFINYYYLITGLIILWILL